MANAIPGFLSFICLGCCFFPSLLIRKSPLQAVLSPFHACGTPYNSPFKERTKINRLFIRKYLLKSIYKDNFVTFKTKSNYEKRKNIIYQSLFAMSNNIFPGVANAIPGFLSFICLGCCFFPSSLIRKSPLQTVLSPFHACGTPYNSPFKERTKINRLFIRKYLLKSIYKDNFVTFKTKSNYEKRKNIIYQSLFAMSNNIFPGVANAIPGFLSFICLGRYHFPRL